MNLWAGIAISVILVFILYKFFGRNSSGISEPGKKWVDPDELYNIRKKEKQKEMDRILEKIEKKGMGSLSGKEKDFLDRF